jgi:hypothetical protein
MKVIQIIRIGIAVTTITVCLLAYSLFVAIEAAAI